jgi:hypothetical protein
MCTQLSFHSYVSLIDSSKITDQLSVIKTAYPTRWRLMQGHGDDKSELVVRIQGVISHMDLPPITIHP